ncbi:hypothetical protein SAMN05428969_3354 [Devosia sp. YR412]|uniref:hypothetical protein n=1 Tax=Devosia sp. YR412 TaxID=1881030 RepID=UPI0008D32AF7|nr:hypothetical protein [Devosia sp. YR412]SEQ52296.1 hypothetical protein SAMN05428969_3354 [Devosia sp. YR412]
MIEVKLTDADRAQFRRVDRLAREARETVLTDTPQDRWLALSLQQQLRAVIDEMNQISGAIRFELSASRLRSKAAQAYCKRN